MLSEKEKGEIRTSYRQAARPHKQIRILSQLYNVPEEQILDVLGLEAMPQGRQSRERAAEMAETIHHKIMAETAQPAESPCKACPLEGCCELVRCSVKNTAKRPEREQSQKESARPMCKIGQAQQKGQPQAVPILSESEGKCKTAFSLKREGGQT